MRENKSNIANFFKSPQKTKPKSPKTSMAHELTSSTAIKGKSLDSGSPEEVIDENPSEDINTENHAPGKRTIEHLDEIQKDNDFMDERVKVSESQEDENMKESEMGGRVKTLQRKPTKRAKVTPTKKVRGTRKVAGNKITSFFGK